MTRCIACDELIADRDVAHSAHEDDCDRAWCTCNAYVHPWCCRECHPIRVPVPVPDVASTRRLPRRRSA